MPTTSSPSTKLKKRRNGFEPTNPNEIQVALSYDDVLLVPQRSSISSRRQVVTRTRLTRNIELNIPIVAANMDTVTEAAMATAIARQGGIGIIHRFLSIEDQVAEVRKVKRAESFVITQPYTIQPEKTVEQARLEMERLDVGGFVVVDEQGKLVGLVSARDVRFVRNPDLFVQDVMTPRQKLITAPADISLEAAQEMFNRHKIEKLPLVEDGNVIGLVTAKDLEHNSSNPLSARDGKGRLLVGAAIGVIGEVLERAEGLLEAGADVLVVDVAHGHSDAVIDVVKELKKRWPDADVIAGNVATGEGARELIDAGVDAVKVGVGPGSTCTTRLVTGAGVPQITAIQSCVRAATKTNVPVISDGGVKFSGDVAKALAAGADVVMIGSLFAGTEEAPGEVILFQGRSFKTYRGMGSIGAMREGSRDRYAQESTLVESKLVPEGIEGRVAYKGTIAEMTTQLVGGLRSGMGYTGCRTIKEFQEKSQFIRITSAGLRESHVHDVIITKEAPNYRLE